MVFSPFPSSTAMQSSGAAGTMVNMAPPRAPFWQEQGWPSEAAWKVAGSPAEAYSTYVAKSQSGAELSAFGSDQPSEFVQAPAGSLLSQLQEQRQGASVVPGAESAAAAADFISESPAGDAYRAVGEGLDFANRTMDVYRQNQPTGLTTAPGFAAASDVIAPKEPWELALELTPLGTAGDIADARRIGTEFVDTARRAGTELMRPGFTPEPQVIRVAVQPSAIAPSSEGLAASRGAVNIINPSGVRILGPDELPVEGEQIFFHGTAGGMRPGGLEAGAFLTPSIGDAEQFARIASNMGQQAPGPVRRFLADETGSIRLGGEEPTDPLSDLAAAIRKADEAALLQEEMFDVQRREQFIRGSEAIEEGLGVRGALEQMSGRFDRPDIGADLPAERITEIEDIINTAPDLNIYQRIGAWKAIQAIAQNERPQPAELADLRLLFPKGADDLVSALDERAIRTPAIGLSAPKTEYEVPSMHVETGYQPSLNLADDLSSAMASGNRSEAEDLILREKARILKENERQAREGKINFNFLSEIAGLIGSTRSMMASLDFPILRQGQGLGWAHPVIWKEAAIAGLKAVKGDSAFFTRAALESSPVYSIKAGPYKGMGFTDPDIGGKIYDWGANVVDQSERVPGFTGINESFIGRLTGTKNPVARVSERTHATTLNVEGMRVYEQQFQMALDQGLRGEKLKEELRRVAQIINHGRGYGSLNPGKIIPAIDVFFSGRNMVSVFDRLLDPLINIRHPMARNLAAKNLASYAAGHAVLLGFLSITGAYAGGAWSVGLDPYSSDFGKVRVGNTSFDTTGGMAPTLRLLFRLAAETSDATGFTGAVLSPAGITNNAYRGEGWRTELINFFRNKESPAAAKVTEILTESDWMGRPQSTGEALSPEQLAQMWFPFITGEVYDAYTQNPAYSQSSATSIAALAGGLGLLGVSSQTYRRAREEVDIKLQQEIAEGMWQSTFTDEDGNLQPVQTFNDLEAASPEAAELFRTQNKPLFDFLAESQSNKAREQKELQEEFYKNQLERDKEMAENPEKWRLDSSDQAGKLTAYLHQLWKDEDFDAEPDSKLDRVQNEYHEQIELNTINGVVDWDEVDKWMAMLDDESQRLLFESRLEWETPARQQYIKDIEKLIPYWDIKDKVFREATRNDAMFNQFDSANDAVLAITNQLMDELGLSRDEAKQEAQSMLDIYMDISRDISYDYLAENPELIKLLDKYGYDVPNIFQDLAR